MRTDNPADNFCSKMVETDVLDSLVGLLHQDSNIQSSSIEAITALVKLGRLVYNLYYARTDDSTDSFRSKMVKTDVLDCLVGLLQNQDSEIQQSSVKAITALAKFGRLIYNFVLCKDS